MTDILNKTTVLVLNRNWQAIHVRTPQEAFCMMATSVATALEIESDDQIRPVTWEEWLTLPIRRHDNAVQTMRGPIRVPTVVVAVNFAKVRKKRPKPCTRTIRERDGNRCQYTGKRLRPEEGSLDHLLPRSRGGKDTWENIVWSSKDVSARKGNRLPARGRIEAALRAACLEGVAGVGTDTQCARRRGLGAVRERMSREAGGDSQLP